MFWGFLQVLGTPAGAGAERLVASDSVLLRPMGTQFGGVEQEGRDGLGEVRCAGQCLFLGVPCSQAPHGVVLSGPDSQIH